jgi:hypothetical protein
MSKLPFFTWHNILCAAVVGAVGVCACVRACDVFFTPAVSPSHSHVVAVHNNIRYARQHGVRSARLPRFGEMFQWRKSSVCCFGARGAVKRARGTSISLAPPSTSSFALATPTDGSIKFC